MIFSKVRETTAQASIEGIICMLIVVAAVVGGTILVLNSIGTILATRWAASNSRCIAMGIDQNTCREQTSRALSSHFAFKKIQIHNRIWQGIIHTQIDAELMSHVAIKGQFDLGPSEYKRVPQ